MDLKLAFTACIFLSRIFTETNGISVDRVCCQHERYPTVQSSELLEQFEHLNVSKAMAIVRVLL